MLIQLWDAKTLLIVLVEFLNVIKTISIRRTPDSMRLRTVHTTNSGADIHMGTQ